MGSDNSKRSLGSLIVLFIGQTIQRLGHKIVNKTGPDQLLSNI